MKTAAASPWPGILAQAWQDLLPFHGRFGLTWRVALLCALVAATGMILEIPEASISCYLVIFLMKEDAVQNCIMGVGLILLATGVVAIMIPLINATVESPAMRLAIIFFATYIFVFLSSTTPLGEQAAIVGLIMAFIMTLVPMVPVGQIGDQGLLMAWKMACMPMFLMVLFNLVLGIPAHVIVRKKIVARLRAAATDIETVDRTEALCDLLGEGNDLSLQQMMTVRLLNLAPKVRARWLNGAVQSSYRIMLAAWAMPENVPAARRCELAALLRDAAGAIESGERPECATAAANSDQAWQRELFAALAGLSSPDGGGAPRMRSIPIFAEDAFSNPDHQRYALQTSVAATLCYLIYTGLQWDGIHTAMITCYVAALGTTGETTHKLTLRIVGCLIGAGMGWFTLAFVMPHLTSIGGLMGMVFCGVMVASWVASGQERIQYAGMQIALAFFLTTLNGFGPSYEISQASDRIYGILLGIFVIYLIFTQFWPRSVMTAVQTRLSETVTTLSQLASIAEKNERDRVEAATAAQISLAQADELLAMAPFEPARHRAAPEEFARMKETLEQLRDLAVRIYLVDGGDDGLKWRLQELAARTSSHKFN